MLILNKILNIIFPPLCFSCQKILPEKNILGICESCKKSLNINFHFFCPLCRRRLPKLENNCHKKLNFVLGSPFYFENKTIQNIIHNLKYHNAKGAASLLAFFIVEYLLFAFSHMENKYQKMVLIPVPLHKKRERQRGYNQAYLLAKEIKTWKEKIDLNQEIPPLEINAQLVFRIKNTPSQTELKEEKERKENVKNAFIIKNEENFYFDEKTLIAIVDDVFTSGATISEIYHLLKKKYKKAKIIALTASQA